VVWTKASNTLSTHSDDQRLGEKGLITSDRVEEYDGTTAVVAGVISFCASVNLFLCSLKVGPSFAIQLLPQFCLAKTSPERRSSFCAGRLNAG
jgi:hypothetical protein